MTPRRFVAEAALAGAMLGMPSLPQAGETGIEIPTGIEALSRRDVPGAIRNFQAATTSANPAIRATAEQWLAHVAWAVQGDTKSAAAHLERAFAQARDSSMLFVELARLEGARGNHAAGMRWALAAMNSVDAERRGIAARTFVDVAVEQLAATSTPARPIAQRRELQDPMTVVRDTLLARVARLQGRTIDAQSLLYAGIILEDGNAIERAWKSYFALLDDDAARALDAAAESITRSATMLREGTANEAAWRELANGLMKSRLYEHAGLLIRLTRPPSAAMRAEFSDLAAYADFLRGVRSASTTFYRNSLAGMARPGDLDRAVNTSARALWAGLSWPDLPRPFYPAAVSSELARRFSTVMSIERDGSTPELYLAHAIATFPVSVAGARPAPVVILDGSVTNGIDAWLLDGTGGRAGWVSGDSVFELRAAFTEAPFRAWLALADPQTMPGESLRIKRDSAADIARARRDSTAYLPGVAARVFRAGARPIIDSLYDSQMSQAAAQLSFAKILFQQLTATSITLHELRHLVDARSNRPGTMADAEFRAKIAEVTGSSRPKLAMTAILSPTVGAATPHGQANRRIMLGLARWIRKNGAAVAGYDPSMPALLFLPNLTDAQMLAAFGSMRTVG